MKRILTLYTVACNLSDMDQKILSALGSTYEPHQIFNMNITKTHDNKMSCMLSLWNSKNFNQEGEGII